MPDVSSRYADLNWLCPALFSVGTKHALLDNSLFMHASWVAAGNDVEVALYSGRAHGFTLFATGLADRASERMDGFLLGVSG